MPAGPHGRMRRSAIPGTPSPAKFDDGGVTRPRFRISVFLFESAAHGRTVARSG
ncbi:hypothetical protein ACFVWT_07700 [Arthrobacter sp. NPDC058288]|uniref:hypothetical protein n=1 Tax=Arthrobacter sp. NPDC058288 TaxID=3346424 RepID=UPI0036E0337D